MSRDSGNWRSATIIYLFEKGLKMITFKEFMLEDEAVQTFSSPSGQTRAKQTMAAMKSHEVERKKRLKLQDRQAKLDRQKIEASRPKQQD